MALSEAVRLELIDGQTFGGWEERGRRQQWWRRGLRWRWQESAVSSDLPVSAGLCEDKIEERGEFAMRAECLHA